MLVRYKKNSEKIAMGLLSFMPQEKDIKKLRETILTYEVNSNWHLFLWKKEEDFVGLIGIETSNEVCLVQHITVNPSHRGDGIGKQMVSKVQHFLPCTEIVAAQSTKPFLDKCLIKQEGTDA
ncbi:GNAT family N-acetyltransferase [Paenisporosarcina sp. TG-14]|uniref:GNAT family N-acetyltransferase n=1 Tax=Paenisporosarcina sp. TG-14 TaxID=1231057 RepID=UPI000301C086|nr:GNAT family N-acetyltransferase [Paenisporosarcina sp. TG-14]